MSPIRFAVFLVIGVTSVFGAERVNKYMEAVLENYKTFIHENDLNSINIDPMNMRFREGTDGVYVAVAIKATGKITGLEDLSVAPEGCGEPYRDDEGSIFAQCPLVFHNLRFDYDAFITYGSYPEAEVKVTMTSDDVHRLVILEALEGEDIGNLFRNRAVSPGSWKIELSEVDHVPDEAEIDLAKRILKNKTAAEVIRGEFVEAFNHAFVAAVKKTKVPRE